MLNQYVQIFSTPCNQSLENTMADTPKFEISRKSPNRVWDCDVPVIIDSDNKCISAFVTGNIEEPSIYNELCYLLYSASSDTTITIHINTPGGIIDSAFMIVDAIVHSQAKVIGKLSGTVASAGTIIAMACHDIDVAAHLSFMIHNYSGGMAGKGHEMKARQRFTDMHLNDAFKSFYKGFLSSKEMESVIDGTDLWMGSKEVQARWKERLACIQTIERAGAVV